MLLNQWDALNQIRFLLWLFEFLEATDRTIVRRSDLLKCLLFHFSTKCFYKTLYNGFIIFHWILWNEEESLFWRTIILSLAAMNSKGPFFCYLSSWTFIYSLESGTSMCLIMLIFCIVFFSYKNGLRLDKIDELLKHFSKAALIR